MKKIDIKRVLIIHDERVCEKIENPMIQLEKGKGIISIQNSCNAKIGDIYHFVFITDIGHFIQKLNITNVVPIDYHSTQKIDKINDIKENYREDSNPKFRFAFPPIVDNNLVLISTRRNPAMNSSTIKEIIIFKDSILCEDISINKTYNTKEIKIPIPSNKSDCDLYSKKKSEFRFFIITDTGYSDTYGNQKSWIK